MKPLFYLCRMIKTLFYTPVDSEKPMRSAFFSRAGIVLKSAWRLIPTAIFFWYVGTVYQPFTALGEKWQRLRQNPFPQQMASEELARAGHVDIPDKQVQFLQKVLAYIQEQTAPDEKIFDFSSLGASYFFANRPSVTRYHQIVYAATPAMQREVIAALESDRTRIVLFKTGWWFDAVDGVPAEQRHPIIAAYLWENYEPAVRIYQTQILQREGEEVPVEAPYGVSPYSFGPFPEVPPDYPNQNVWSETRLLTMQPEHELLSRVRIKLWHQGVRTVGAVFRMDYGRIFPTREDVVYIEWADSVAADGQMYVVRMLSSPATINQYEEDIYRGIFPPHLTIYEFPDGGIDPYEFLGSPRF